MYLIDFLCVLSKDQSSMLLRDSTSCAFVSWRCYLTFRLITFAKAAPAPRVLAKRRYVKSFVFPSLTRFDLQDEGEDIDSVSPIDGKEAPINDSVPENTNPIESKEEPNAETEALPELPVAVPFAGMSVASPGTGAIAVGTSVALPSMSEESESPIKQRRLASTEAVQQAQRRTLAKMLEQVKDAILFNSTFTQSQVAVEQKGFGLSSAPTLKLNMSIPEDKERFDSMLEPVRWLIDDVDDYIHGFSTCASESFNNRRLVYASKNREYTMSFEGRSKFSGLIHNQGINHACIAVAACIGSGLYLGNFSVLSLQIIADRRSGAAGRETTAEHRKLRKKTEAATAARLSLETLEAKGDAVGSYISMGILQPNTGPKKGKRARSEGKKRMTDATKRELFSAGDPRVWQCGVCKRLYAQSSKVAHSSKCAGPGGEPRSKRPRKKFKPCIIPESSAAINTGNTRDTANSTPSREDAEIKVNHRSRSQDKTIPPPVAMEASDKDEKKNTASSRHLRRSDKRARDSDDDTEADETKQPVVGASNTQPRKSSRATTRVLYLPVDEEEFEEWEDASHLLD